MITLSREKDIADNILWTSCARGWAIARQGRPEEGISQLCETIRTCKAVGAEINLTHFLALLAEAYICAGQFAEALATVEEALAMTARNRDCYYDAELQRLRGELLLLNGATEAEAEACFQHAIEIAQQQSAKVVGTARRHEPRALVATTGQDHRSTADAGGDLRLVHRRLCHGGFAGGAGVAGGIEFRVQPSGCGC